MQLSELEKIRVKVYESAQSYKRRLSYFMTDTVLEFALRIKVLVDESKLHLVPAKLRFRWTGAYVISFAFPNDAFELQDLDSRAKFNMNN